MKWKLCVAVMMALMCIGLFGGFDNTAQAQSAQLIIRNAEDNARERSVKAQENAALDKYAASIAPTRKPTDPDALRKAREASYVTWGTGKDQFEARFVAVVGGKYQFEKRDRSRLYVSLTKLTEDERRRVKEDARKMALSARNRR